MGVVQVMHRLIRRLLRIFGMRSVYLRRQYPGLGIPSEVMLDIQGDFSYGSGCGLNQGTNIIIPAGSSLSLGDGCYIGRYVEVGPGGCIALGREVSIQDRCILLGNVSVGQYSLFAPNVYISSGRHHFRDNPPVLIRDQDRVFAEDAARQTQADRVVVEEDCWIGINAVVMAGVTIGKGAIVGANSVVTKDVPPYTVVAGAPARVISKRLEFSPPRAISSLKLNDLPYFYSGFDVSQHSQPNSFSREGYFTQSTFSLCLEATGAEFICLEVKSGTGDSVLRYADSSFLIKDEIDIISCQISEISRSTSKFEMETSTGIFVRKAWVK